MREPTALVVARLGRLDPGQEDGCEAAQDARQRDVAQSFELGDLGVEHRLEGPLNLGPILFDAEHASASGELPTRSQRAQPFSRGMGPNAEPQQWCSST